MIQYKLTNDNFEIMAAKFYESPLALDDEFQEDLKRIIYIKRLLNQLKKGKDVPNRDRLILNHIIIMINVFGKHAIPMLFLKLPEYYSELKTYLVFLSYMPETISNLEPPIKNGDIPVNTKIALNLERETKNARF